MTRRASFAMNKLLGSFRVFELFYISTWCAFLTVIWSNMLVYDGTAYWAGWGHLWADWSAHITYVLNMSERSLILPYHPLYWGIPFRYHFVADMISAVLLRIGVPLVQSLVVPSMVCSFLLIISVYMFYRTLFKSAAVAMLSVPLFIFNGGLGFLWFLYYWVTGNPILHSAGPIFTLTQIDAVKIEFANIVTNYFIPQRAFLLGFPISVFIILYLWNLLKNDATRATKWHIASLAVLTGLFPIVHVYSFITILGITGFLSVWNQVSYKKNTPYWYAYLSVSAALGWTVFHHFWGGSGANSVTFYPLWSASGNVVQWVYYWIKNEGVLFVFSFIGYFYLTREQKILSIPFAIIFFMSNMFIFQPHEWDNGKFITYSYLWSAGIVGNYLWQMFRSKIHTELSILFITLVFIFGITSGAIDVLNLMRFEHQKILFFEDKELVLGKKIRTIIQKNDILLTGPITSYISILTGRQVLMGLDFWVSSYGIDTKQRGKDIQDIYEGKSNALTLLSNYRIRYVLISEREREILKVNDAFFNSHFHPVLQTRDAIIYKI